MPSAATWARALAALTEYVGATHYLLARYDLSQDDGLDFVVCSDWPFDVVRRLAKVMSGLHSKTNELEKCLSVLHPCFMSLPDDVDVSRGISREYCSITFNVGRVRLSLMLLFPMDVILSQESLRDVGLLTAYFASFANERSVRSDRDFDLTERELECLFWIAEGKTSDEIAMILGISRNTINNYITSVMRKTATKTAFRGHRLRCSKQSGLGATIMTYTLPPTTRAFDDGKAGRQGRGARASDSCRAPAGDAEAGQCQALRGASSQR